MTYQISTTRPAEEQFLANFRWIQERSTQGAASWRDQIIQGIQSLAQNPERFPLARENPSFAITLRHVLIGKGTSLFRIIFTIHEQEVRILAIMRGTKLGLDLNDPP